MRVRIAISIAVLALAVRAAAQDDAVPPAPRADFRYSLSVLNDATVYGNLQAPLPGTLNQVLVEQAFTLHYRERWTLAVSAVSDTQSYGDTHENVHLKESYLGLSAGDFDFMAGRRLVRWGTGYAFTPAGVLDPPRIPTNPTDRLNTNVGRDMAKVDFVHGSQAMQLAWSTAAWAPAGSGLHDTTAFRYNVLVRGFDTSLIASHDRGGDSEGALTFTRVFGQGLEVHGEAVWRDEAAILLGGKYVLTNGVTFIGEFYTPPNTAYFRDRTVSPRAGRQHYGFIDASKSRLRELPGWKEWDLDAYIVTNLDDHSATTAFDATRRFGNHFSAYVHGEFPTGSAKSEYGATPYKSATSMGVRFQL